MLGEGLRYDPDVWACALEQNGSVLIDASAELRADRRLVGIGSSASFALSPSAFLSTLHARFFAVPAVPQQLRQRGCSSHPRDRWAVAAVASNGLALRYASEELRADKDVALAAVRHRGRALEHAGPELRADLQLVLAAVQQDAAALRFASAELQEDGAVLTAAKVQRLQAQLGDRQRERDGLAAEQARLRVHMAARRPALSERRRCARAHRRRERERLRIPCRPS